MQLTYFKTLEAELQSSIQQILEHEFIVKLNHAELTKNQIQKFAIQYSIYCSYFPRFLAAAAAQITDDEIRLPIIANLWEEHGCGDLSKSHRNLFKSFMNSLEIENKNFTFLDAIDSTKDCCEKLYKLCASEDYITSLGALGPGTEFFTSPEYALIEDGLKKYDFTPKMDIEFWTVHIEMDNAHYSDMLNSLNPFIDDIQNQGKIMQGALFAINLEIKFWDGLAIHCI